MERRRRDKEAQLTADLENARALLGSAKVGGGDEDGPLAALRASKPNTKEDWEAYAEGVYEQLLKPQTARTGFDKYLAPRLLLLLGEHMRDADLRLTSNKLRELAEKKIKAEKEAKKAGGAPVKKPKPKNVSTASAKNKVDLDAYGEEALDDGDLDFM